MKFRISDEDAARYGCDPVIEFDEMKLMGREAIALKKLTGWTPERIGLAQQGTPVVDDDGKQMFAVDEDGNRAKDPAGQPIPLRSVDPEAILVITWLAIRRAVGHDVPWSDFDINLAGWEQILEDEEGKAPPSSTTSKPTTNGTKQRSRTPSASRRGTRGTS